MQDVVRLCDNTMSDLFGMNVPGSVSAYLRVNHWPTCAILFSVAAEMLRTSKRYCIVVQTSQHLRCPLHDGISKRTDSDDPLNDWQ